MPLHDGDPALLQESLQDIMNDSGYEGDGALGALDEETIAQMAREVRLFAGDYSGERSDIALMLADMGNPGLEVLGEIIMRDGIKTV